MAKPFKGNILLAFDHYVAKSKHRFWAPTVKTLVYFCPIFTKRRKVILTNCYR